GRLDLGLARLVTARRNLPEEAAEHVAILADEDDGVAIEERQHADRGLADDHAVDRAAPARRLGDVLAHAHPRVGVDRSGRERAPRRACERTAIVVGHEASRVSIARVYSSP